MKKITVTTVAIIILGAFFGADLSEAIANSSDSNPSQIPCDSAQAPAHCREIEAAILASTVQVTFRIVDRPPRGAATIERRTVGYATVKDGRYLVTHNHYQTISPAVLMDQELAAKITITLYQADGQELLTAPATSLVGIVEDGQTSLFDFGHGFFNRLGIPSAEMADGRGLDLEAGVEVAQLDWDGDTAHVDWVQVDKVLGGERGAILLLDNCIKVGASGGGIFLNGVHVANNLSRSKECQQDPGLGLRQYSKAALNQPAVAGDPAAE
jgi:hypothetical protein